MKLLILFTLLFTSLAYAGDFTVNFSHENEGRGHFSASVYELVLPGETESPLWDFVQSLESKLYTSEDKSFIFTCAQAQVNKSMYETRCSIEVKSLDQSGHVAASQSRWATLLTETAGFKSIFASSNELIKINIKDKFKIREISKNGTTFFYLTFEK